MTEALINPQFIPELVRE